MELNQAQTYTSTQLIQRESVMDRVNNQIAQLNEKLEGLTKMKKLLEDNKDFESILSLIHLVY